MTCRDTTTRAPNANGLMRRNIKLKDARNVAAENRPIWRNQKLVVVRTSSRRNLLLLLMMMMMMMMSLMEMS